MRCRVCYEPASATVFSMDPMPLAGQFCASREEALAAEKYPLHWFQCQRCGLAQVLEDIPDNVLYGTYNYASSTIPGVVKHFMDYAVWLTKTFEGPQVFLEIGCNDGVLLRQLPSSWRCVGVDPSDVAAKASKKETYEFVPTGFSEAVASGLEQFDVISASNCLAHISDLGDVFRGIRQCLKIGGALIVEVHDLDATLRDGQWDNIYHEHKAEWSTRSLANVGEAFGLELHRVDRLRFHGGLLRAHFRRTGIAIDFAETRRLPRDDFERLQEAYDERRGTAVYARMNAAPWPMAAYGAAGRANVWFNQHPELDFAYVVDDSPLRAGKWIPSRGIPIVGREKLVEDPKDVCIITAWDYADAIRARNPGFQGQWITNMETT